jgi:hypothetical protein
MVGTTSVSVESNRLQMPFAHDPVKDAARPSRGSAFGALLDRLSAAGRGWSRRNEIFRRVAALRGSAPQAEGQGVECIFIGKTFALMLES